MPMNERRQLRKEVCRGWEMFWDEMSVLFYASLPLEVKQILRVLGTSTKTTIFNFELPN
jgi:hypothetical protein